MFPDNWEEKIKFIMSSGSRQSLALFVEGDLNLAQTIHITSQFAHFRYKAEHKLTYKQHRQPGTLDSADLTSGLT